MDEVFSQQRGRGPALLLICGGTGDSRVYDAFADLLADRWTVLTYDLPGHARSSGPHDRSLSIADQAEVAAAVLAEHGHTEAAVFGSSSGALVAAELTVRHQGLVTALYLHEPPMLDLLPDAAELRTRFAALIEQNAAGKTIQAYAKFLGEIDFGSGFSAKLLAELPSLAELRYFLGHELPKVAAYQADLTALRATAVPITPMLGANNRDKFYARAATALAAELNVACAELPGAHMAYLVDPAPFARTFIELTKQGALTRR